jgi:hypothetical protein
MGSEFWAASCQAFISGGGSVLVVFLQKLCSTNFFRLALVVVEKVGQARQLKITASCT